MNQSLLEISINHCLISNVSQAVSFTDTKFDIIVLSRTSLILCIPRSLKTCFFSVHDTTWFEFSLWVVALPEPRKSERVSIRARAIDLLLRVATVLFPPRSEIFDANQGK